MGRVAGSYGVRGWIRVAGDGEALAACGSWRIGATEYPVEETKAHSGTLLAKLRGVGDRERAMKLKGRTVAVARGSLPELAPGKYYFEDLIGLEVMNGAGVVLGNVRRIFFNGAHDVMEVTGDRTRLLPWVPAVVKSVEFGAGRIEVEWGADW